MILSRNKRITRSRSKRVFFDLNHPADYHFFKHLLGNLSREGYLIRITARNKECLHELLHHHGIRFTGRGRGSHSLVGKYIYGIAVLMKLTIQLARFRPGLAISLSSPYLILTARLLGIPSLTYDDTDDNPRLLRIISRSDYLFSPASYPFSFHKRHFRLETFKELAYLHPRYFNKPGGGDALFIRLTRTDSVHHKPDHRLDESRVLEWIWGAGAGIPVCISTELQLNVELPRNVQPADRINIHRDLSRCRVFWGNSATMAAEAAILGIPAVYVEEQLFAYLRELEEYGLLFHFTCDRISDSFLKVQELLSGSEDYETFASRRSGLLSKTIDVTRFLNWFVTELPASARQMEEDPQHAFRFRTE